MRKWVCLVLAVVLLGATIPLVGCSSDEEEVYVIGAIFSTTGGGSNLGVPEKQTIEMLVDQINEAGGINGHELQVIIYDDESKTDKAATLATKLIEQDNVLAIIGPTTSGSSMAIVEIVTNAQIPLVSCAASIDIVVPIAERYWIFKTPQTEVQAIREIYAHLEDEGITDIAIITCTSAFGTAGMNYLKSEKDDYGINIIAEQTFDENDTDMTVQLTNIKATDAEAVICWATDKESAIVAQNMVTLGMTDMPLYCSHGVANMAFIDNAGDAANGVIFPAGKLLVLNDVSDDDPQKSVLAQYKTDFEALYTDATVSTFGGHAYDALKIVVMAIEALGDSLDGLSTAEVRAAIRDQIEETDGFIGTGGVFTMSATDHLGMASGSLALIKVVDGEWTCLQ